MFDSRKVIQLFALFSVSVVYLLTTAKTSFAALSVIETSNVIRAEKLGQRMSVILASSDNEKSQLHQQTNVKLEELENIPRMIQIGEREVSYRDIRLNYYNNYLRTLNRLPSEGQSIKIHTKDNNIQRLLKEQLNDALEIYQIVGQLLDTGEVDINLNHPSTLPAIQVAIAEMNLATNPNDQATANEVCLNIAQRWQQDSRALERAGLGTRSDVL
ncbi:hypothetical protein VB735_33345 [Halotia wernerae UHCC 0503]|nr:hypothetical protein [Halotia wernerae UHCC 0503]